jgi:hypothetical protein
MIFTSHPARRARLIAGIALVAVIGLSLPAAAAQLVKVRAGAHANFTRVVFELDGASGYRVEKVGTDAAPMLRITLDAGSRFHRLNAHGDVRGESAPDRPRSLPARIRARGDPRAEEEVDSARAEARGEDDARPEGRAGTEARGEDDARPEG